MWSIWNLSSSKVFESYICILKVCYQSAVRRRGWVVAPCTGTTDLHVAVLALNPVLGSFSACLSSLLSVPFLLEYCQTKATIAKNLVLKRNDDTICTFMISALFLYFVWHKKKKGKYIPWRARAKCRGVQRKRINWEGNFYFFKFSIIITAKSEIIYFGQYVFL